MVSIIVAVDEDWGIAKDGKIPWKSKADMAFFKDVTVGAGNNAVVMGRKTKESLPKYPLPNRANFTLTRTPRGDDQIGCVEVIKALPFDDVWVIGGADVYSAAIKAGIVDVMYVSKIDGVYDCDQFFDRRLLYGYRMTGAMGGDGLVVEVWQRA